MKYLLIILVACASQCPTCPVCDDEPEIVFLPDRSLPKSAQPLFEHKKVIKKK